MASKNKKVKFSPSSAPETKKEDLRAAVAKLRAELEAEQKTNRHLRREKALEVQQIKEETQLQASNNLRELTTKLNQEKQKEVELQKEILRCKLEAENSKVVKAKEQEIKKLKQDLAKCQDELKEEISKRGLSTSARGTFELERQKLLQEVREQTFSKKHLESELQTVSDALKRKNIEIKQLEDTHKIELVRVEKAASSEVKKLLEELKTKDNMLAMMDRNLYADKTNLLKCRIENLSVQELLNLSREVERVTNSEEKVANNSDVCVVQGPCALQTINLQKKLYELEKQAKFANGIHMTLMQKNNSLASVNKELEEKVKNLTVQINSMRSELMASTAEITRLNEALVSVQVDKDMRSELEHCNQRCTDLQNIIVSLRNDCKEKDKKISSMLSSHQKLKYKYRRKKSVRFLLPDEEDTSLNDSTSQPSFQEVSEGDDLLSDEIIIQNIHKDYEKLMAENLKLSKYCAKLHQQIKTQQNLEQEGWFLEKESLNLTIHELENQLREAEEREALLKFHLEEARELNEENEFRIFELEECAEKNMSTYYEQSDIELIERNRFLESEVNRLSARLAKYEAIGINEMENDSRLDDVKQITDLLDTAAGTLLTLSAENLRKLSSSLSSSDDDNPMVQSFSTVTSGFDDVSCISLDLDEKSALQTVAEIEHSNEVKIKDDLLVNSADNIPADTGSSSVNQTDNCAISKSPSCEFQVLKRPVDITTVKDPVAKQPEKIQTEDENNFPDASLLNNNSNKSFPENKATLHDNCPIQRIQNLEEQVEILDGNDAILSMTIEALECLNDELTTAMIEDIKIENEYNEKPATHSSGPYCLIQTDCRPNFEIPFNNLQYNGREETFGFLSPTCMGPEWSTTELRNQTIQFQMLDLEREREHLQNRVCKNENVISDLRKHIAQLEQSERNLRYLVERLESAEQKTREKYFDMESVCGDLKRKLKRAESNENLLRQEVEKYNTMEYTHGAEVQNLIDAKACSESKLKKKIAEIEQDKCFLETHVDELANSVRIFEDREINFKQRIKCLEENELLLKEKCEELEIALNTALDNVARVSRQRDHHLHEMSLFETERGDMKKEITELKDENCKLTKYINQLKESERFLTEANKKMWFSLRVNLDDIERECEKQTMCDQRQSSFDFKPEFYAEEITETDFNLQDTYTSKILVDNSAQTDQLNSQKAALNLKPAVKYLHSKDSNLHAEFVLIAIKSWLDKHSSFLSDDMKKFISSEQLKCSNRRNSTDRNFAVLKRDSQKNEQKESDGKVTDKQWLGEEMFWSIVEDTQDIYDIRAADQSKLWLVLENLIGVRCNDLVMSTEPKNESVQSIDNGVQTDDILLLPVSELCALHQDLRHEQEAESADEVSEIHDEDDGAMMEMKPLETLYFRKTQTCRRGRSKSAGNMRCQVSPCLEHLSKPLQKSAIGLSVESFTDSGMDSIGDSTGQHIDITSLDQECQTEATESKDLRQADESFVTLQQQLEYKDKALIAQMHEVDRLSQEVQIWQQKAAETKDQIASMSQILDATTEELQSMKQSHNVRFLNLNMQEPIQKTRFEPYASQIPVSVRQPTNCQPKKSLPPQLSYKTSVQSSVAPSEGSVHTAGSSLPQNFTSLLPRPVPDKSKITGSKTSNSFNDAGETVETDITAAIAKKTSETE